MGGEGGRGMNSLENRRGFPPELGNFKKLMGSGPGGRTKLRSKSGA